MTEDKATFLAYFPAVQSAWKIHGAENGARIQLDIPENQMGAAVKMLAWRQKVLKVTVEVAGHGDSVRDGK